jgi:hypothetical protein
VPSSHGNIQARENLPALTDIYLVAMSYNFLNIYSNFIECKLDNELWTFLWSKLILKCQTKALIKFVGYIGFNFPWLSWVQIRHLWITRHRRLKVKMM